MFVYSREQEGGGAEHLKATPVTSAADEDLSYQQTEAIASPNIPPSITSHSPKIFSTVSMIAVKPG